ncbi:hypothetical protein HYC85_012162 [Camellia sinensis]|uniref:mannan endo-1,4-beta-mannosidase n=1 Tax=Camellia sinensis TaxID=4442 RepID=A0A7J7HBR4_CAMSI|nr:hypothetical protein HYC85_012162 [Camellia sinensis]
MVVKSSRQRQRMVSGNGLFYPIIGFASCFAFMYLSFGDLWPNYPREPQLSFVQRNGTHFILDGRVFYINGWNSYWLMDHAVDEYRRPRIRAMLQAGAKMGLTVCRTWAFNDGVYNALQISPGQYDERVFKALDHVIAEARHHGVRLLLSLVNNLQAYGGKTQYVKWAWEEGIGLSSSNDSFFFDPSIRHYFKNHVKDWIEEMSTYVKSIDKNHLVTVGLEGFYGPKSPKRLTVNPGEWAAELGSDFIRNSKISTIDFASVHIYPDHWFHDQELEEKLKYVSKWMVSHIEDGDRELKKPVTFTEFGLSNLNKGFKPSQRDQFYKIIYDIMYKSSKRKKSGAGSFVWQFLVGEMEKYNDDFGIVPWERPATYQIITEHSCRLAAIQGVLPSQKDHLKELCLRRQ